MMMSALQNTEMWGLDAKSSYLTKVNLYDSFLRQEASLPFRKAFKNSFGIMKIIQKVMLKQHKH